MEEELKALYTYCQQDVQLLTCFMKFYKKVQTDQVKLEQQDTLFEYMVWNMITDYDDSYNTGEPYPYDYTHYNKLNEMAGDDARLTENPKPLTQK